MKLDKIKAKNTIKTQSKVGRPKAKVDVDDEIITMIKFTDGAVGTIEATRNAYGRNNYLTFEVHGTKG